MGVPLPPPEACVLDADRPGRLVFSGSPEADLFTREVAESFAGVLAQTFIRQRTADGYPPGFVRASVPPRPWWDTMWTRDAGTFLRELVAWGYLEHAALVARCLIEGVARNEAGFHAFPERLYPGRPEAGDEVDGTAAIVIGMVHLWRHLPPGHPMRASLYEFLHEAASPVRHLQARASEQGLIAGTGEFGPGCGVDGYYCSCVQNHLAALALRAVAQLEAATGAPDLANAYRTSAEALERKMLASMRYPDGSWMWGVRPDTHLPDARVLEEPVNRGTGLHNGVASMYPDACGLDPLLASWPLAATCEATFDRLLRAPLRHQQFFTHGFWPQWDPPFRGGLSSGPSYGEGYALQTMLLFDRLDLADRSLRWLARATYDAPPAPAYRLDRPSRFFFYERTYSPDALGKVELEEGCGALNLVNVSEPLKVARLMLGVDITADQEVRLAPRLPACVRRIVAEDWPLLSEGRVVRARLALTRNLDGSIGLECEASAGEAIRRLAVRHGTRERSRYETFTDVRRLQVRLSLE
ncbi:MAG TPA: hypothetical protein PLU52_12690 [Opitutaceae bacterium]|nr:hypothetical protein [Opitutaceae bacterium]